jgi:hypothetical protein
VFQVAAAGDEAAREAVAWSARELGASAAGVIRQLGLQLQEFDVVLIGSVFDGGALFTQPMQEVIRSEAPGARFVRLQAPPVVGALLLGMAAAGDNGYAKKEIIIQSTLALPMLQ